MLNAILTVREGEPNSHKNIGWTNRSKTTHSEYYSDVVSNFSRLLQIDPWLLEPQFRNCGEIDFQTKQGEDCLVHHATKLFSLIEEKYNKYSIDEKPYIMIKADSGTYGMGIILIDNINDLKNLNINVVLFVEKEKDLPILQNKYFDIPIRLYNPRKERPCDVTDSTRFISSKRLIEGGKEYLSYAHWKKGLDRNNKVLDTDEYWRELDHFYIYEPK